MKLVVLFSAMTLAWNAAIAAEPAAAMKKHTAKSVAPVPAAASAAKAVPSAIPGVIKMPIGKGIKIDEAVESMKLRANYHNMKLVAELPLSKQVEAMTGKTQRFMTIYQFCDALTAKQMVDTSVEFAAYLPCRIAVIEDAQGQGWLVMTDLNPLINTAGLTPALKTRAIEVRDQLESIMKAGAAGEL